MTAPPAHEVYEELAVGYALSALEPADEQAFLSHLPSCAGCERALAVHVDTLAHLAYDAPDLAPPTSVLQGIRAGVQASGRAGALPAPAQVGSLADARRRRLTRRTLLKRGTAITSVAAGIVMVVALVVSNRALQERGAQSSALNSRLSGAVTASMLDGATRVPLAGHEASMQGVALLKGDDVQLVVAGLAPNDRSRSTYVLWERSRMGAVRSLGTFDVTSTSADVVQGLHLDHGTAALASLVVTREKGRRAPATTTQPAVLAGELPVDRA